MAGNTGEGEPTLESAAPESGVGGGIEIRRILGILSKWRWVIAVLTGVSVLTAAFLAEFVLPKVYQATTTLDVSSAAPPNQTQTQTANNQGLQGVVQTVSSLPQNTLQTYQWQVTNHVVLAGTAKAVAKQGIHLTTLQLSKMVKASLVPNTNLITVNVQDTSPRVAALVANDLTTVYLATVQSQDHTKLAQAVGVLQRQVATEAQQLNKATSQLAQVTAKSGAGTQSQAELQADNARMTTLRGQLTQARVQLQADQAEAASLTTALASTPKTVNSTQTVTQTGGGSSASQASGQTTHSVSPNPTYQQLAQQLASVQGAAARDQATVSALGSAIVRLSGRVSGLSSKIIRDKAGVQALQSQVTELTSTYQTLTRNLTQAQVSDSMSLGSTVVTVAAPATLPKLPIKPNKKLDVALALVLGLVVSVGLSFLLETLDNTIKSPEDLERLTKAPTLAVIPHFGE